MPLLRLMAGRAPTGVATPRCLLYICTCFPSGHSEGSLMNTWWAQWNAIVFQYSTGCCCSSFMQDCLVAKPAVGIGWSQEQELLVLWCTSHVYWSPVTFVWRKSSLDSSGTELTAGGKSQYIGCGRFKKGLAFQEILISAEISLEARPCICAA